MFQPIERGLIIARKLLGTLADAVCLIERDNVSGQTTVHDTSTGGATDISDTRDGRAVHTMRCALGKRDGTSTTYHRDVSMRGNAIDQRRNEGVN